MIAPTIFLDLLHHSCRPHHFLTSSPSWMILPIFFLTPPSWLMVLHHFIDLHHFVDLLHRGWYRKTNASCAHVKNEVSSSLFWTIKLKLPNTVASKSQSIQFILKRSHFISACLKRAEQLKTASQISNLSSVEVETVMINLFNPSISFANVYVN